MKEGFHPSPLLLFFLFFFLLFSSSTLSIARNIIPNKELVEVSNGGSVMAMEVEDSTHEFVTLMGEVICKGEGEEEEEECLRRRIMLEAHLDYIYTQHHKP